MIFIGFIIGFLGYLPPGNINLTVVQMSSGRSKQHLWYFICFAALMEFIYCFGSLVGMKFLFQAPTLILALKWSSVLVFSILGILSLIRRSKDPAKRSSALGKGVVIAILNPLQIPFWLIWGVYAMQNHWVEPNYVSMALFSLITASGSLLILWLYGYAGRKMEDILNGHQRIVNVTIGLIFIGLAILQLSRMFN